MARIPGKDANFSFGVAIEDELNSIEMSIDVSLPEVTALADAAAEYVEGHYSGSFSGDGSADFAASQGDATIFGQIGSGEAAFVFQPTGNSANTNDPNYTGNALVRRYSVRAAVGAPVSYRVELAINGAVSRDVS